MKPWLGENRLGPSEREDPALILGAVGLYSRVVAVIFAAGCAAVAFLPLPLLFSLA